jgi:DNA uptake protein ComE-like DNA-binding protein
MAVHLTTASFEELITLPNVGEKRARSIIEIRKEAEGITMARLVDLVDLNHTA